MRFTLFLAGILILVITSFSTTYAQPPKQLEGKWIGDIRIIIGGDTSTGYASINIGSFLAKDQSEIEVEFSNYNKAGTVSTFKWISASFNSGEEVGLSFPENCPSDFQRNTCEGKFHFANMEYIGIDLLYGEFHANSSDCKNVSASIVLFKKQYVKTLPQNGKRAILPDVRSAMMEFKKTESTTTSVPSNARSANRENGKTTGYTIALDDNPVILDADKLDYFNHGYAVIQKGQSYALINANGKIVIPFNKYKFLFNQSYPTNFPDNRYLKGMPWPTHGFINGMCVVQDVSTGKWGALNTNLQLGVPCIYDNIGSYFDEQGHVIASIDGKGSTPRTAVTLNQKGEKVPQTVYRLKEGDKNYGIVSDGIVGLNYESGMYVSHNLYVIAGGTGTIGGSTKYGFANRLGKIMIQPIYKYAMPFYDGLAAVAKDDEFGETKWGFINLKGELVIPYKFSNKPGDFHNGLALVEALNTSDFKYAYINKTGEIVFKIVGPADCQYRPLAIGLASYSGYSRARRREGTYSNGYALWYSSCRTTKSENGLMLLDTLGKRQFYIDLLKRNGWPTSYYTPQSDFVNNEIILASGSGVEKDELEAIVNIKGEMIIKTPRGGISTYGSIGCLFDDISGLASASITINNKTYSGYVDRQGKMKIIIGETAKW